MWAASGGRLLGDRMVARARTRTISHGSGPDDCLADHLRLGICDGKGAAGAGAGADGADAEMVVRDIREMVVDVVDIRMDESWASSSNRDASQQVSSSFDTRSPLNLRRLPEASAGGSRG